MEVFSVKLGGSSICDKSLPYSIKFNTLYTILDNIIDFYHNYIGADGPFRNGYEEYLVKRGEWTEDRISSKNTHYNRGLILVHGGGSFGHPPAAKYRITGGKNPEIIDQNLGLARTHTAMVRLNSVIIDYLLDHGVPALSLTPFNLFRLEIERTEDDGGNLIKIPEKTPAGEIKGSLPFRKMLSDGIAGKLRYSGFDIGSILGLGIVPVFYGDILFHDNGSFSILSGDVIISFLPDILKYSGGDLGLKRVIFTMDTPGILDKEGRTIAKITYGDISGSELHDNILRDEKIIDVTGGLAGKLSEIAPLLEYNCDVILLKADDPENPRNLLDALSGNDDKVRGTFVGK